MLDTIVIVLSAAFAAATFPHAFAAQSTNSSAAYKAAKEASAADYKSARAQCKSLSGNGKDVCIAEAKAARKRSNAEAEAQYKGTAKARTNAVIAAADGDYAVAKARCGSMAGNAKDVCIKDAKAAHTRTVAEATARLKSANARADAREETRAAEYKAERERCDALAGTAKDNCVRLAKAKTGG